MFTKACSVKPNLSSHSSKYLSVLPPRQPASSSASSGLWELRVLSFCSSPPLFLSHQPPPDSRPHQKSSLSWGHCTVPPAPAQQPLSTVPQLSGPHQLWVAFLSSARPQALHPSLLAVPSQPLQLLPLLFIPASKPESDPTFCRVPPCDLRPFPGYPTAPASLVRKRAHTRENYSPSTSVTEVSLPTREESNSWRVESL